jgi:hypothetical protein
MTNEINLLVNDSKTLAALLLHNFRNKVSGEKVPLENISRRAQKKYLITSILHLMFPTVNFQPSISMGIICC